MQLITRYAFEGLTAAVGRLPAQKPVFAIIGVSENSASFFRARENKKTFEGIGRKSGAARVVLRGCNQIVGRRATPYANKILQFFRDRQ